MILLAEDGVTAGDELRASLAAFMSHALFDSVMGYVMRLRPLAVKEATLPADFKQLDQSWRTHLCSLTRKGLAEYPGNSLYGYAVILLATAFGAIPLTWYCLPPYTRGVVLLEMLSTSSLTF